MEIHLITTKLNCRFEHFLRISSQVNTFPHLVILQFLINTTNPARRTVFPAEKLLRHCCHRRLPLHCISTAVFLDSTAREKI